MRLAFTRPMETMTPDEVRQLVRRSHVGVLGLAKDGHAYVVPLFYGSDGRSFYFHTRAGAKTPYLDATQEACLTIVHAVTEDDWASVMAFGRVEEVVLDQERVTAMDALLAVPLPPEWGFTPHGEPRHTGHDLKTYKLTPTRVTGRKSSRPPAAEERELALGGM